MGAAAAAVLLRRAIRRAFHAVCNLLVLFLLLVLMLQDQLQGRKVFPPKPYGPFSPPLYP